MPIAPYPSRHRLPEGADPKRPILEYLCERFPAVDAHVWEARIREGKVRWESGEPLTLASRCVPLARLTYFREVPEEPRIPYQEEILFANEHFLVADKPPFLPISPAGPYIHETLVMRLRACTGNDAVVPLHRLDRHTSGLVLLSTNPETRGLYGGLFREHRIEKSYEAQSALKAPPKERHWLVENRLVEAQPWFRMKVGDGPVNARSRIEFIDHRDGIGHFRLHPVTGKQHQLRVHMSALGFPILGDRYYPELLEKQPDDFDNPLRLLARRLRFVDPVSGERMEFVSGREF